MAGHQRLFPGDPSRWSLVGFKAVVTGSTKGIGRSIAEELLGLGAEVLLVSRNAADVEQACSELNTLYGGHAHAHACDVSQAAGRETLVGRATQLWGGYVDVLVNNVGTNVRKSIEDVTDEDYRLQMNTNVDSAWYLCKMLKPLLENANKASGASVVNISSIAGVQSTGTGSVYAMTKAAMAHLALSLACEWGPLGIRVNTVCPSMTMTPLLAEAVKDNPAAAMEGARKATPLGRVGDPEDTAGVVAFLCMPSAAFVTGQVICVDGGLLSQGYRGPCIPNL